MRKSQVMRGATVLLAALACWSGARAEGFVKAEGTRLTLDGQPYRAVGVNIPHLAQAYNGTWHHWKQIYGTQAAMRQSVVDAVADAERCEMRFVRFFGAPGYPKGTAELYLKDKAEYWRQMDELFALCRQHHLKLVPSLGALFTWASVCGEPRTAILNPQSKTYAAAYGYVREFVTRYKDDPTVLMWELENESFLHADVDVTGQRALPKGVFPEGASAYRETYTAEDSLRFDTLVRFYREMTSFIKGLDANHLVTSGDSGVREESLCRRQTYPKFKWRQDTLSEHLANLVESQPKPLDLFSLHDYGNFIQKQKVDNLPALEYVRDRIRALHAAGRPVFIGELGQMNPAFHDDPEAKWTRAALDALDQEGVALIALWVWHFPWQDKDHNIPSGASQPLLMKRVAEFNRQATESRAKQ